MTESQFIVLLGVIWIAPHTHPSYAQSVGSIILICAACKGLGWIA